MVNKYYQKHKERLQKEPHKRYQNISKEEKVKRRKKTPGGYQNFTEEEKEKRYHYYSERKKRIPDYSRDYYLAHKK